MTFRSAQSKSEHPARNATGAFRLYVLEITAALIVGGLKQALRHDPSNDASHCLYVGYTSDFGRRLTHHLRGTAAYELDKDDRAAAGRRPPRVRPVRPFKDLSNARGGAPLELGVDVVVRDDLIPGGNSFSTPERANAAESRLIRRLKNKGHTVFGDE